MGFKVTDVAKYDPKNPPTVTFSKQKKKMDMRGYNWWTVKNDPEMLFAQFMATGMFLKNGQQYRTRQMSIYSRLYNNVPLGNLTQINAGKASLNQTNFTLPNDRPSLNVISSCTDTLVSAMVQSKPRPIFLTDDGDWKQRRLAKQLNSFITGELYQNKAYELGEQVLRDSCILGDGCVKIYRHEDKVKLERVLVSELYVDLNDGMYHAPRTIYQFKLVDRAVLASIFEKKKQLNMIENAPVATIDATDGNSTADLIIVCEAWHLPSGKDANDGMHVMGCGTGLLDSWEWEKNYFPFEFINYAPNVLGFWSEGISSRLLGTQCQINKLLITISQSQSIVGVPRIFLDANTKVNSAHFDDQIGTIIKHQGPPPVYSVAQCVPPELYSELGRLKTSAYEQEGISQMTASSLKPEGLDSGNAIREYNQIQSTRFTSLSQKYDNFYIGISYKMIDQAKDIAEDTGKYETVYPEKNSSHTVDLPKADLVKNPFIIQCFDSSSLPRDPAGRKAAVIEYMQSGVLTLQEGKRLLDFPDLEQQQVLANAPEERILKILDDIVENGKYTPPDPFIKNDLANTLVVQYINLFATRKLDEERMQMLRDWYMALAQQVPAPQAAVAPAQANPMALPQSPMVPNNVNAA